MPRVFISYSHDTNEHKKWVLQVSEQLRSDGLECQIDQYIHGFPPEGWPSWMEKQIEQAAFVLIVCSELYLQRFRREDPSSGRGVAFEGAIITQTLYDHHCRNKKFVPVIPAGGNLEHVPIFLKSFTAYHLPGDYTPLYRLLTNQPAVVPSSVGAIKVLPPENAPASIEPPPQGETILQPSAPSATYDPRNPAFLVPFREKGKYMVGREEALKKVHQQLLEGKPTSIGQTALFQGMGGLGKTQLAVEYAYQYRDAYPNGVYWITADGNIDAQLTKIAVDARWVAPESEHATKLDIARHRIKSYSDCLIVFDNLETADAIRDYLPEPQANPHILVTSRSEQPDFSDIKLDLLNDGQSYAMLVQEAGRQPEKVEEETAAREIASALGGLPLALELAGAYLAHRPISWCTYRDLLRENLRQALPKQLSSLTKHDADLFKTLSISEKEIGEEPLLAEALDLLTWSGTSTMGLPLMAHLLNVKPVELHNALGLGVALRLLQQEKDSERYAIHRLVQEVRRQDKPLDQHNDWVSAIAQRMGDWFETIRDDFRELPAYEAELEHLRAWQVHAELSPIASVRLLWLQAYPADHRGRYNEAAHIVQQALETYESNKLAAPILEAHLFNDIATCQTNLGDYRHALESCSLALNLRREIYGDKHPDVATSYINHASILIKLDDCSSAFESCTLALEIQRDIFADNHPDIANSLSTFASCHAGLGNLPAALDLGKQSLEMRRKLFGNKHPDIANSLSNMASYFADSGNFPRALELGVQSLEMRQELLGEKHPDVAHSLCNIATYLAARGKDTDAREVGDKSLKMLQEFFGDCHPEVAISLSNLASIHANLGNQPKALELYTKTLEMRRKLFGENHPDTINSLLSVALRLYRNPFTATKGQALIDEFLRHIPRDHPSRTKLLNFLNSRDGFRKQAKDIHRKNRKK